LRRSSCNLVRLQADFRFGNKLFAKNLPRSPIPRGRVLETSFAGSSFHGRASSHQHTSHTVRLSNSSTNLLPVSFFKTKSNFDGNESGSAHGPVLCRCVASRSPVGVSRRQAVGGRAIYGTLCRPLVRVLFDALASCDLVRVLRRVHADCDRWMGDLATRRTGGLLSDPRFSADREPVPAGIGQRIGQLVPVRVRT
jgi:hypothetical protein